MGYLIRSPKFSFIQFNNEDDYATCFPAEIDFCLPIFAYDDIAFQFIVVTDTVAEADALCVLTNDPVSVGIVNECGQAFLIDFFLQSALKPDRFRISEKQVLYNWSHGLPGYDSFINVGECFRIKITINGYSACSNCIQRIADDCYTSVVEYGSNQNIFDFNYCGSGAMFEEEEITPCEEPTIFQFVDATEINYTYTAAMQSKYGIVPTVEIWIWDTFSNQYVKPVIQVGFDAYPPTKILADLGGLATGFMKIS